MLAVALRLSGTLPHHAGVKIYQNGYALPTTTLAGAGSTRLEWADTQTLVGYDQETSQHAVRVMSTNSSGVTIDGMDASLLAGPLTDRPSQQMRATPPRARFSMRQSGLVPHRAGAERFGLPRAGSQPGLLASAERQHGHAAGV